MRNLRDKVYYIHQIIDIPLPVGLVWTYSNIKFMSI